MTSRSGTGEKRLRPQSVMPGSPAEDCEGTECARREQGKDATLGPSDRPQHVDSTSSPAMHTGEDEEAVITCIRATDVALGLRRLPAGFYAAVHHSGLEWRTENKRSSANDDVVEWDGPIPIPPDLSTSVCLEVYASFELQPMLGTGEQLRKLTVTVEQLLDRSAKDVPFTFFPKDGDVVSPCSSVFVTVKRRKCESSNSSVSRVLGPHRSTTEPRGRLKDATNQGHSALSRYRKHGRKRDLERSIEEFELALRICPQDHPCRAATQSNLATAKFILYRVEDTGSSLEVPLGLYRNALAARPVGHLDRPSTLIQLAAVHFARFEKRRDEVEEARVEALLHEAMELSSTESHEHHAAAFTLRVHTRRRLGPVQADRQSSMEQDRLMDEDPWISSFQLLQRFKRSGDLADLHQAITGMEELVRSTSIWDHRYCAALANLGVALCYRFNHLGELSDLEDAISRYKGAIALTPDGHPDKPDHLGNLGGSLRARFERLGEPSDLEDAISMLRSAVDLTPHGHPQNLGHLGNLGSSFFTRFNYLGELSDLEHAISTLRDAVDLIPHGHPQKPGLLNNLGISFNARFARLGDMSDLEHAISTLRDAVDLTPHSHPDKPGYLNNFGDSFLTRFERLGQLSDLEETISTLRVAVDLTPRAHPNKPACFSTLGNAFKARFQRLGELSDIEDAISALRDAVDLTPSGHPGRFTCLNNLGNSFRARFERLGEPSDLDSAISTLRGAVNLIPHGHPQKPACLNNIARSLTTRFKHLGELSDLESAISMLKDAVDLTPDDDPRKLNRLSNLGYCFIARFERRLLEPSDLEDAISRFREAVALTPCGHPDESGCLSNLANSLKIRFMCFGEPRDLEDAITMLKNATDLTPHDHPDRAARLNNLGGSSRARFERLGELSDLEDAISMLKDAVDITPDGHPDKAGRLSNLGHCFRVRFEHLGELSDLEDAISTLGNVIDLTPHGHPDRPARLSHLGHTFIIRSECLGEPSDLEQAISLYSHAASTPIGPVSVRFDASQEWISCARRISHHSLLHAYSVAISLLPQLAWIGLPLTFRYAQLRRGANVMREAAAAALDSGLPEAAVEWLEQGRSIVWGELLQLRSSHEKLSSAHPDHARRLRELSSALEHASAARENSFLSLLHQTQSEAHHATESLKRETDRYRTLAIERDQLLQEIRGFPGFERFLLQKEFSQFRASAHSGPVVILNAAERRCDALIVLAGVDHVIHVPLPTFTFKRSTGLQNMLEKLLGHVRVILSDDREGHSATRGCVSWEPLLSTLWNDVVRPVLHALAFSTPGDLSRIFWCPTGPFVFLPIHAAGLYGTQHSQAGHKVSDFVVSSYVPTLSILALSPNTSAAPDGGLRFLAVRQPPSDGLPHLPGVAAELEHIRAVIRNSPSARTTILESSVGTVEEVLALMKEADWVHFACHGIQDDLRSGLCLADGHRLKLRDIIALSRPRGGLAFLSACETATGDELLPDEAIHIAAGMLFAGYGGVISTMWSISDKLAPGVAKDVYKQLFRNGAPDYREAALALHKAIERLRDGDNAPFVTWLPFVHVGL